MDIVLYAIIGAVLLGPIVIWQRRPRFPKTAADLQSDNFQKLYDGQNRFFGSKEANDAVRLRLREQGDDLSSERIVDHFAAVVQEQDAASYSKLSEILQTAGFTVGNQGTDRPDYIQFSKATTISSMVFDKKTMELNDFLYEHGWQYDGWGCAVVTTKED